NELTQEASDTDADLQEIDFTLNEQQKKYSDPPWFSGHSKDYRQWRAQIAKWLTLHGGFKPQVSVLLMTTKWPYHVQELVKLCKTPLEIVKLMKAEYGKNPKDELPRLYKKFLALQRPETESYLEFIRRFEAVLEKLWKTRAHLDPLLIRDTFMSGVRLMRDHRILQPYMQTYRDIRSFLLTFIHEQTYGIDLGRTVFPKQKTYRTDQRYGSKSRGKGKRSKGKNNRFKDRRTFTQSGYRNRRGKTNYAFQTEQQSDSSREYSEGDQDLDPDSDVTASQEEDNDWDYTDPYYDWPETSNVYYTQQYNEDDWNDDQWSSNEHEDDMDPQYFDEDWNSVEIDSQVDPYEEQPNEMDTDGQDVFVLWTKQQGQWNQKRAWKSSWRPRKGKGRGKFQKGRGKFSSSGRGKGKKGKGKGKGKKGKKGSFGTGKGNRFTQKGGNRDILCHNCLSKGHFANACKVPRQCIKCASKEHLSYNCPRQQTSRTPNFPQQKPKFAPQKKPTKPFTKSSKKAAFTCNYCAAIFSQGEHHDCTKHVLTVRAWSVDYNDDQLINVNSCTIQDTHEMTIDTGFNGGFLCSKKWLNAYLRALKDGGFKDTIQYCRPDNLRFQFGAGSVRKPVKSVYLPIFPDIKHVSPQTSLALGDGGWPIIKVQIVNNAQIGLLLGSIFLESGKAFIDYDTHSIRFHGYTFDWTSGSASLPMINIGRTDIWCDRLAKYTNKGKFHIENPSLHTMIDRCKNSGKIQFRNKSRGLTKQGRAVRSLRKELLEHYYIPSHYNSVYFTSVENGRVYPPAEAKCLSVMVFDTKKDELEVYDHEGAHDTIFGMNIGKEHDGKQAVVFYTHQEMDNSTEHT
ncbi:MAG: hypothetical protein HRT90_09705, partial [Candidatus Margulisbacteria bacterium]|nr:hypothetical protein [Candidatus Margulisiibacteriota bacterium]